MVHLLRVMYVLITRRAQTPAKMTHPPVNSRARSEQGLVTDALAAARDGAPGALDRVFPLVYGQLRDLARRRLAGERSGHTLSTTALVHEAYVKLIDQTRVQWQDRAHFFAVAAGAMRRILVDHARRRRAVRRGGAAGVRRISLDDVEIAAGERAAEIVALDEALERLAGIDPRQARVVELRFFGGLSEKETGDTLGISQRTVAREWVTAKGWLYRELRGDTE
jgi:RNA polymerase sigma-70 factor, ECF subfamily